MDDQLIEYAQQYSSKESDLLSRINRETHLNQTHPQMLSGHHQGLLLQMISRMIRPERILEIGSFTGYSAICLAAGLPTSGMLHTIEANPELEPVIRKYLEEASLANTVILHIGDAAEIIPTLGETWDLVFIDADKPNYRKYYGLVLPLVRSGGIILADNALWSGKVLDPPSKQDSETRGICEFNEFVQSDRKVENLLLPFRDGLMIIRKL
jgi:caffeoyl-CoA O-methyltransferase